MVDPERVVTLIKTTYPFHKLDDDLINLVVNNLEILTIPKGQQIYRQGLPADEDSLCIILDGKVNLTHKGPGTSPDLITLGEGDVFGYEMLESDHKHPVSSYAVTNLTLLTLDRAKINLLVKNIPGFTVALRMLFDSYLISLRHSFVWKDSDEVIYLATHRHKTWLYKQCILPALFVLFSLSLLVMIFIAIPQARAGFGFIILLDMALGLGWVRLLVNNWENNIIAITNQRLLFQERKMFVYETRVEVPLNAILSVAMETTQTGRLFNFGNVVARTFAGAIHLPMVMYPDQVAAFLELQWSKTKVFRSRAEAASMENIVRNRLGISSKEQQAPNPNQPAQSSTSSTITRQTENWLANLFKLKLETAAGVVYKTHWLVLFQHAILPSIFWIGLFGLLMGVLFNIFTFPGGIYAGGMVCLLIVLILTGDSVWVWYCYEDWANDIYIISADQIIDRVKKPFGKEESNVAPLRNVQSVEFERGGLLGLFFNFGSLKVAVGDSKLEFRSIYNPSDMQREIFKQMAEREYREKQMARENEQKWVVDWIAAYHRVVEQEKKSPEAGDTP